MHRVNIPMEGYTLTYDKALSFFLSGKPEEFTHSFLDHIRKRTFEGEPDAEEVLIKLIKGYPTYPLPYFFLAYLYLKLERDEEAQARIEEMCTLFPSYFYTLHLQAIWFLKEENYEQIPALFGPDLEIQQTYPGNSFFFLEEFMLYQGLVGTYYIKTRRLEEAEQHIQFLKGIDEQHDEVQRLIASMKYEKLGVSISETLEELEHSQKYLDPNYKSQFETVKYDKPKVGRNDPCPCGSGKKYKKCCL